MFFNNIIIPDGFLRHLYSRAERFRSEAVRSVTEREARFAASDTCRIVTPMVFAHSMPLYKILDYPSVYDIIMPFKIVNFRKRSFRRKQKEKTFFSNGPENCLQTYTPLDIIQFARPQSISLCNFVKAYKS